LCFAHADAVPLFSDVSLDLEPGWTGVVGANGAGKSTLFALVQGALTPTRGFIRVEPATSLLRHCLQEVEQLTDDIVTFSEARDATSRRLHGRLALKPWEIHRWESLSPGERKRWQIGAALSAEPHVLLLDEPTNHLDGNGRMLLLDTLRRHRGVGLIISHDRVMLDELTTRTLRIHGGEVTQYPGGYSAARALWEGELAAKRMQKEKLKETARGLGQRLGDARRDHHAATLQRNTGRRMKDKYDSDARGLVANFVVEQAQKGLGRSVATLRLQVEKAQQKLEEFQLERTYGGHIFVDYERAPISPLFTLDASQVSAGDHPVLGEVHVVVGREDRIRITGPNGAGKTTLIQALMKLARIPPDRILIMRQDLSRADAAVLLHTIQTLPHDQKGRVLSFVAALGVDPSRVLASKVPSPGEARKLLLALGLGRHVWCLVLDEPTNHLDLPSIERLEAALAGYPGAILVVTHDAELGKRLSNVEWEIRSGQLTVRHDLPGDPQ